MTKKEALCLMEAYCQIAMEYLGHAQMTNYAERKYKHMSTMHERFPEGGSTSKAMRWLGFMQGVMWANEFFSLEELKQHSKNKVVS